MTTTIDLDSLHLDTGAHGSPEDGACIMEAVSLLAGEVWSDTPACASPVLGAFLRSWNDSLPDDERQQLKQYIPRLVGSKGTPAQEDERAWMAMDWLIRTYTPAWLRLAGLNGQAATLASLPEFQAGMDVPSIRPAIDRVRKDAAAAWAAARAAARDAAGDAAWDAARAAAGDAAGDAARDAAWVAARAAARDAARDALAPTKSELQTAAHVLVDRMLAITEAS